MLTRLGLVLCVVFPSSAALISDVRFKLSAGDLSSAEALVEDFHRANGTNSEYAAAVAWLARGALMLGNTEASSRYLADTKALVTELLKTKRVEDDSFLESAAGTAIEVEAQSMAARGAREKAVTFLEAELPRWKTWPVKARIQRTSTCSRWRVSPRPSSIRNIEAAPCSCSCGRTGAAIVRRRVQPSHG